MNEKATIYALARVCKHFNGNCSNCPLDGTNCTLSSDMSTEEVDEIILNWCNEHPAKTRQDKFLELFPNAKLMDNEILAACPKDIDKTLKSDCLHSCLDCRKSYWLAEVEK